jgi:hypothetical protein
MQGGLDVLLALLRLTLRKPLIPQRLAHDGQPERSQRRASLIGSVVRRQMGEEAEG